MSYSSNAGLTPDVKFLRAAGIVLAVLALSAGTVSIIGATAANDESQLRIAEAASLEQGAEALFEAVDENVAERHRLAPQ
jgi:hypothetical protein